MSNYQTVWTIDEIVTNFRRGVYADSKWTDPTAVTFGFATSQGAYPISYGEERDGFSAFTAQQQQAAILAISLWTDAANIEITGAADGGQSNLRFANTTTGPTVAEAYMPEISGYHSGDIWLNPNYYTNQSPEALGGYGFLALLHEIGHSIGLPHPGDYNAGNGPSSYYTDALYQQDTRQYTVMSYFGASNTGADHGGYYASTPLLDDIAAIQYIYGENTTTRPGDTVYGYGTNIVGRPMYDFTVNTHPIISIWDGGGNDTIDLSGSSSGAFLDLNQGTFSNVLGLTKNLSIAYGAVIENAIGTSGSDTIIGNAIANFLIGGLGSDSLVSGEGNDILQGGPGDDYLTGGAGLDVASYADASGGVNVDLNIDGDQNIGGGAGSDALVGIEYLIGSNFGDRLIGNGINNYLSGGAGNDYLLGSAGDDYLTGGTGFDVASYADASGGVSVDLNIVGDQNVGGGAGADALVGIEYLVGSSFGDRLIGNGVNNYISGGGGNDVLQGGAGDDYLTGDAGFDVASYADASGGVSVDLNITGDQNVGGGAGSDALVGIEYLIGSNFADTLIGNAINNYLSGLAGNDVLQAGAGDDYCVGGAGNDSLSGGTGADAFAYNAASEGGDTITDFVHGTDKIDLAAIDGGVLLFQAGATTSVAAHSVNWYETDGNTVVQADVNGNTTADFQITLLGTGLGLTPADFTL